MSNNNNDNLVITKKSVEVDCVDLTGTNESDDDDSAIIIDEKPKPEHLFSFSSNAPPMTQFTPTQKAGSQSSQSLHSQPLLDDIDDDSSLHKNPRPKFFLSMTMKSQTLLRRGKARRHSRRRLRSQSRVNHSSPPSSPNKPNSLCSQ